MKLEYSALFVLQVLHITTGLEVDFSTCVVKESSAELIAPVIVSLSRLMLVAKSFIFFHRQMCYFDNSAWVNG